MSQLTVVFDFDGVIHSYTSGWKGPTVIPDPPVPGIKKAIDAIRAHGYIVAVVSTRCKEPGGIDAIADYLKGNGITVDVICAEKPPAIVYIDDRAICFDGLPETLLDQIVRFQPWNKKPEPLSLEDLKSMDGQPVWVVPSNFMEVVTKNHANPEWGLVNYKEQKIYTKDGRWYAFCWNGEDHSKGGRWVAYRRPVPTSLG
jgi:hypothetical protein